MLNKGGVMTNRLQQRQGDIEGVGGEMTGEGSVETQGTVLLSRTMPSLTFPRQLSLPFALKTLNKNRSMPGGLEENSCYIFGESSHITITMCWSLRGTPSTERQRLIDGRDGEASLKNPLAILILLLGIVEQWFEIDLTAGVETALLVTSFTYFLESSRLLPKQLIGTFQ